MSLTSLSSLLFYAGEREGTVTAKAALCCDEDMGALCCEFPNVIIEKDEDGIQYLTLSHTKGGRGMNSIKESFDNLPVAVCFFE